MIFLKNVRFDVEHFDFGNSLGMAASVGEGDTLLRFGVSASLSRCIKPAVYAPDEKVYVTKPDEVPLDDDDYCPVEVDEGGFFYVRKGTLLEAGESERISKREVMRRMLEELMKRLNAVYVCGKLLEEGAREGSVETARVRMSEGGELVSLLTAFGLDKP